MIGILLAYAFDMQFGQGLLLYTVLGSAAILYVLFFKKLTIPLMIIALCLGNVLFINQMFTDFNGIKPHTEYTITGRVCDYPDKSNVSARYVLADVSLANGVEEEDFSKKVLLRTPDHSFEYGDIVTFRSVVYRPEGENMPGAFNNQIYLASRSIGFSTYSASVEKTGYRFMPYEFFVKTRGALAANIDKTHSRQTAPIAKAMFLGIKNEIPDEIRSSFARTGISHILAISGLHIAIIALLLNFLLGKTKMKRDARFIFNITLLLLYISITGFPISVVRAGLMTILILVGRWKFVQRDTLVFLSAAMAAILLASPAQLFMPGFLLSFGTVFGILCLYNPFRRLIRNRKTESVHPAGEMLCVSLSASAASYPMTAYYFNNIALIAPLTNFIAVPSATFIVIFTGLAAFGAFLSVGFGKIFAVVSESFIKFVVVLSDAIAQTGWGYLQVYRFPVWIGVAVFAGIFICSDYFMVKIKKKAMILACLFGAVFLLAAVSGVNAAHTVNITFLDVGNGEGVHIEYRDEDILVTNATEEAAYNVNSYTERNGIQYDLMVLTESGPSHYDGALDILRTGAVHGEIVYTKISDNIAESCRDLGIIMHTANKYDTLIDSGGLKLTVLGSKYNAISLLVTYRGKNVCLLSGHSAKRSEETAVSAPVLKVAAEGNESSVNELFLETVAPEYAVISVDDNPYGLPDRKTLARLREAGITVYRTDGNDSVILTVDKNNIIKMRPMNED
jgi:ComEC/Rec2-related protein